MSSSLVLQTEFPDLKLLSRGKVRDLYDIDASSMLFVATDRLSAFDVILSSGIPGKGKVLTQLSEFWFTNVLSKVTKNHLITSNVDEMPEILHKYKDILQGRSMLVKKLNMIPVEAIVRGYITGSGWNDYQKTGSICGIKLRNDLKLSEKLDNPIFTPSTKADVGDHDENISKEDLSKKIDPILVNKIEKLAIEIYNEANKFAIEKGIILADTKMEFGLDENKELVLADEVLTPDCSRFWSVESYKTGEACPSYDKQFVRDYLSSINFDKKTSIELPKEIIEKTLDKYVEVFKVLTTNDISI